MFYIDKENKQLIVVLKCENKKQRNKLRKRLEKNTHYKVLIINNALDVRSI